jgi:hypothetical protein
MYVYIHSVVAHIRVRLKWFRHSNSTHRDVSRYKEYAYTRNLNRRIACIFAILHLSLTRRQTQTQTAWMYAMPGSIKPVFAILTVVATLGVLALCILPASDSDSACEWPRYLSVFSKKPAGAQNSNDNIRESRCCIKSDLAYGMPVHTSTPISIHTSTAQPSSRTRCRLSSISNYFFPHSDSSQNPDSTHFDKSSIFGNMFVKRNSIPLTATDELQLNASTTPRKHNHDSPFARNYHVPLTATDELHINVNVALSPEPHVKHTCMPTSPFGTNPTRTPLATDSMHMDMQLKAPLSPTPRNADCNKKRRGNMHLHIRIPQSPRAGDTDVYMRIQHDNNASKTRSSGTTTPVAIASPARIASPAHMKARAGLVTARTSTSSSKESEASLNRGSSKAPSPWFMIKFIFGGSIGFLNVCAHVRVCT